MKKVVIIMASLMIMLSGCSESKRTGKVEECFMEYVRTDFGNPKDFVEITSISKKDSVNNAVMIKMCDMIMSLDLNEGVKLLVTDFKDKFYQDTTRYQAYELKVRMKEKNEPVVKVYYVIDRNGVMSVSNHSILTSDVPELYKDFLKFTELISK